MIDDDDDDNDDDNDRLSQVVFAAITAIVVVAYFNCGRSVSGISLRRSPLLRSAAVTFPKSWIPGKN